MILPLSFGSYPSLFWLLELTRPHVPSDIAVFVLVLVQVHLIKSRYRGMGGPKILDTISRDAEIYFAVITTSHILSVIMHFAVMVRFFAPMSTIPAFSFSHESRHVAEST